jgi:hypothetical protein
VLEKTIIDSKELINNITGHSGLSVPGSREKNTMKE